jgi:catechol 2,3-dioxygenase-like lactoylglutathione lyase family enzyme
MPGVRDPAAAMTPRLRQAVLAARDLEQTVDRLRAEFGLGEPYRDPGVAYFGLANAVFALGDTFLEIVSPVDPDQPGARTAAARLDRSGTEICGHMVMLQVDDLRAARERARAGGVREVFEVQLEDIAEVHLHPGDIHGAIVSLSAPRPPDSWRWGGPGWRERAVAGRLTGVTIAVAQPDAVAGRWADIAGGPVTECNFAQDEASPGLIAIELELDGERRVLRPGS